MHLFGPARPEQRTIVDALEAQAAAIPDSPWLLFDEERVRYSFGGASVRVSELAGALESVGVGAGDLVATMMDNCADSVLAAIAVSKLGAAFVPVNTAFSGEFLRHVMETSEARLAVVDPRYVARFAEIEDLLPDLQRLVVRGALGSQLPATLELDDLDELVRCAWPITESKAAHSDPFSVMFTSGTTGRAKGAILSHRYWCHAVEKNVTSRAVRDGDAFYDNRPLFHAGAWLCSVLPALMAGIPVGVDTRFSASRFWDRVRHYDATHLTTIGAMHMYVWGQPESPDDDDNPARTWLAVPLAADLWEPFRTRFGLESLVQQYGQTEAVPIAMAPAGSEPALGSSGWVQPEFDVRIHDEGDREQPRGKIGEICVRPSQPGVMFDGYLNDHAAWQRATRNLWHHTGDLGYVNDGGELFFVDRMQDFLRVGGENISSHEIEAAAAGHPDVVDVAAHGIPTADREDEIKLCVVLREGAEADFESLARYFDEHLPYFAVPRYLEVWPELPRTPTERVQKFKLREVGVTNTTWDRAASSLPRRRR